ncbi:19885_t:CDS:2, partial [Gigaspora rosea]
YRVVADFLGIANLAKVHIIRNAIEIYDWLQSKNGAYSKIHNTRNRIPEIVQLKEKREFSRQLAIVLSESGTTDYGNCELRIKSKEKTEKASNLTHNKAQTYLNMKEILSLKECGTMNYGTRIIQGALISDISKNAISKRKRDPDLSQEDANKQAPTLTESIIQNSKRPKEDTTVTSQQITEISIILIKDKHSTIKTKQEDIYSSH